MRIILNGIRENVPLVMHGIKTIVGEVFFSSVRVTERLQRYGSVVDETAEVPSIVIALPDGKQSDMRERAARERITSLLEAIGSTCPEIRFRFLGKETLAHLLAV